MLPFYKYIVTENDELGVDFNALVDVPAHMKGFVAFGKEPLKYTFNQEKRIVTGVMISANTPIYRHDAEMGSYYGIFTAETIEVIRKKFHVNGFNNNVNKQHDMNQPIKGMVMIDSYVIGGERNPSVPEIFKSQNLQDGTWIASYYVQDNKVWEEVKSGKFQGFSVEGWFDLKLAKPKKANMKKDKKSVFDWLKSKFSEDEQEEPAKFATAVTADGIAVFYEGELAEGVALFVEVEGVQVPAPEGDHQLTLEDGSVKVVTVDANGIITSVADVEAEEEMSVEEQVAELMAKTIKDMDARFTALEAKLETITKGEKFAPNPKKTGEKVTYKDLLKK